MQFHVVDETAPLQKVILGHAADMGGVPNLEEIYDPKSRQHLLEGTYPTEAALTKEIDFFAAVLEKHGVEVVRPKNISACNQIFARDIGFVIEDKFIFSNILPLREREQLALEVLLKDFPQEKIIRFHDSIHVEGGDVIVHGDYIFVGVCNRPDYPDLITARTNPQAVVALQKTFPNKKVVALELKKSNDNPFENALHLDCSFQPVGQQCAIVHPESFVDVQEFQFLCSLFAQEDLFVITTQEMYDMTSNIFSISPELVVSDPSFKRLNTWLESKGISVATVPYREVAKQEGLFRCSTLPLIRL